MCEVFKNGQYFIVENFVLYSQHFYILLECSNVRLDHSFLKGAGSSFRRLNELKFSVFSPVHRNKKYAGSLDMLEKTVTSSSLSPLHPYIKYDSKSVTCDSGLKSIDCNPLHSNKKYWGILIK